MSEDPPISPPTDVPLQYAALTPPVRPALMTAVGIISIVVGSLSALASISGVVSAVAFRMMSHFTFPSPASTPPTSLAGNAPATVPSNIVPFGIRIDLGATILTIVEAVLSLGVAALLIVAGSLVLRNSPRARRLHWIYVVLKLPLIFVAAFATWWTFAGMMNSMAPTVAASGPPRAFGNTMALAQAGISALFPLAYPVALIIILSTAATRNYFKRISATAVR